MAGGVSFVAGNAGFSVRNCEFFGLQLATEVDWAAWERLYSESPLGNFSAPDLNAWIFGSRVAVETGVLNSPGMSSNDGPLPNDAGEA
jgi:hypothetical protein